jgi:hypothetical protein
MPARQRRADEAVRAGRVQIDVPEEGLDVNSLRRSRSPILWLWRRSRSECGRACWATSVGTRGRVVRGRGGQGRAVRPARRESLEGPRSVGANHNGSGAPNGVLGRVPLGLVDTAVTSPLAPRTGRGRPWGSAAGHSFVPRVGAWCVSGHSRAGCTQFAGLARRGPRRSSSSRLGCVRTVLNWPPGRGSGSCRPATRSRPS